MFKQPFVCEATQSLLDAHWQLDDCIAEALRQSKPGERRSFGWLERERVVEKLERKKNGNSKKTFRNSLKKKKKKSTSTSHATSPASPTPPSRGSRSPLCCPRNHTNPDSLEAAVATALELLSKAGQARLGRRGRAPPPAPRREALERGWPRSRATRHAYAQRQGDGLREKLERFLGIYWGQVRRRFVLFVFLFFSFF